MQGGETIKRLRAETGCKITMDDPVRDDRVVTIRSFSSDFDGYDAAAKLLLTIHNLVVADADQDHVMVREIFTALAHVIVYLDMATQKYSFHSK